MSRESARIDPAPILGPVIMSESAVLELTMLDQCRAALQRRLPALDVLDWNEVAFHCTRSATAR